MLRCPARPARLRPGDTLAVVAPSGPLWRAPFDLGMEILSQRYRVHVDPRIVGATHGYLSAPDESRLAGLLASVEDPGVAGILLGRGGYGLLRIVSRLRPGWLTSHPKPIVGFSDGTVLLAAAAREGVPSIHGPVVTQLSRLDTPDVQALFDLLENPSPGELLRGLAPVVDGKAEGPLLGGNLEVFTRLLGTPYLPDLRGAILVLEDVGERPYRLDRLLTHLELAGVFDAVAGVVLGDFTGCEEPASAHPQPLATEVLRERLGRLPIPVAMGAAVGHGHRNRALPYGCMVALDTGAGCLVAREGVVA